MSFYRFSTDGNIEKVESNKTAFSEITIGDLNPTYNSDLHLIGVSYNIFFATHTDNDFASSYRNTKLEINQAIAKYFKIFSK